MMQDTANHLHPGSSAGIAPPECEPAPLTSDRRPIRTGVRFGQADASAVIEAVVTDLLATAGQPQNLARLVDGRRKILKRATTSGHRAWIERATVALELARAAHWRTARRLAETPFAQPQLKNSP